MIYSVISANLKTPCVTRWNSLYDAVRQLLEHKSSLSELCYRLGIPSFESSEIEYLEEYVKVMKPIADAIDYLQGEKTMFFGYFLPALLSIKVKMRRLENEQLKYLSNVNKCLQKSLIKRFQKYFSLESEAWDAVVAAIVIPDVKLKFFKTLMETAVSHTEEEAKRMLGQYAHEFFQELNVERSGTSSSNSNSFLDFGDDSIGNLLWPKRN